MKLELNWILKYKGSMFEYVWLWIFSFLFWRSHTYRDAHAAYVEVGEVNRCVWSSYGDAIMCEEIDTESGAHSIICGGMRGGRGCVDVEREKSLANKINGNWNRIKSAIRSWGCRLTVSILAAN